MKLSNLRNVREKNGTVTAEVDQIRWFRKPVTRMVIRPKLSAFWRFADSGEFTPGSQVEGLYAAYSAIREFNEVHP